MTEETVSGQTEPMRRPLLGIVFCYSAGTLGGAWINSFHFITVLAFAFLALVVAFGLHRLCRPPRNVSKIIPQYLGIVFVCRFSPGLATCFVYLAVFLAGWLAINLRVNSPSGRDISALMDRPREGVEIIGVIADDPALRKNWREDGQYWSFAMKVKAVCRTGAFQKARGEIMVSMPTNTAPHYGEHWKLCGVLIDKVRLANASGLDAIKSQLPHQFGFQVSTNQFFPVLISRPLPWNLFHLCFQLRQKSADILARGIEDRSEIVAILQALVLGRQHELPAALREAFVATGTYHIFAISGQHVAIIAIFIVVVLQAYGIGRLNWFFYLAPVLIIFTIMAGMSASALRGCIMALMCFLGPMFKRKTDISSAMAFAALLIIACDPLQLFQAGFLLSFGIVAGLIILCPPLIAMVERRIAPDPYRLEPENWPARNARNVLRWCLFMMTTSFAAWLVSTPLVASWFNLVSPVALLANLIVIPMSTLVLLTGCLSIVFGLLCPFVAEVFNFANVALVSLTAGVARILAQVPCGHIFVRSPPIWFVCLWLAVLVIWRIYYQKTRIWLAAVLVLLVAGGLMWRSQRNEWEIHVFNIDQGAVCLINKAGSDPLLLNTGPRYQARNVLRYLRKMGVNRIQALACPFPDAKHIGGAKDIIAALPVNMIWHGAKKPKAGFIKELCLEAEKRRIGVGELTNEIWRVQSGRNGWNIDVFEGSNSVIQNKKGNVSAGCPDGPLIIFINAGVQTQMTARILILLRREVAAKDKNDEETWLWRMERFLIDPPMIATDRRFIGNEQTPLTIDIEDASISGSKNSAGFGLPAEAQCRVLCCPTIEERTQNYCGQSSDLQPSARIVLGPGQGVLFTPDKEKAKTRAINLNLSADGR